MKKVTKTFIIVAICSIFVGTVLFCVVLASIGLDFKKLNTLQPSNKTHSVQQPFTSVDIDIAHSDVFIRPSADGVARVISRENEYTGNNVDVIDGTLKITQSDTRKWYHKIGLDTSDYTVIIELPSSVENILEQVSIKTASGDITVINGVFITNASLQSVSGEINLGAHIAGELTLKTTSGDISSNTPMASNLTATTTSGEIEIKNTTMTGNSKIKTVSGDVEIENCVATALEITTTSGDVEGKMLSEMTYQASSVSGHIRVPNTSGELCKITTTSGDIEFR